MSNSSELLLDAQNISVYYGQVQAVEEVSLKMHPSQIVTVIGGSKNGIEAEVLCFVPLKTQAEVQKLTLRNQSGTPKKLKLFSFVEWCLWNAATDMENFQRNFSTGEVEVDGSVIYHKTEYRERRNHYAYYSVNQPVDGYDTDRETFFGLYNGFEEPQTVMNGTPRNSVAHGWSPVASHCLEIKLDPGESKELVFVLGYVENAQDEKWERRNIINKDKAKVTIARFDTAGKVDAAFAGLRTYWDNLLSTFHVRTPEDKLDRMVNTWNQYQCMITFCFSRSASYFESKPIPKPRRVASTAERRLFTAIRPDTCTRSSPLLP